MAKLTKEEMKQKYNETITENDDLLISLLEDIEDSMTDEVFSEEEKKELETLREDIAKKDAEIEELKRKYKERFLSATDEEEPKVEELEEKKVIDITEI
jgi:hypothetical protein